MFLTKIINILLSLKTNADDRKLLYAYMCYIYIYLINNYGLSKSKCLPEI